jgi:hypothetical protein
MNIEFEALHRNETWKLVMLPQGKKPIGCKSVFRTKHKIDGSIYKHNMRSVAKEYAQQEGVDFEETFSPTKIITIRLVLCNTLCK